MVGGGQVVGVGDGDGFGSAGDVELSQDAGYVGGDGVGGDVEFAGYLGVGEASGEDLEDYSFAGGEAEGGWGGAVGGEAGSGGEGGEVGEEGLGAEVGGDGVGFGEGVAGARFVACGKGCGGGAG